MRVDRSLLPALLLTTLALGCGPAEPQVTAPTAGTPTASASATVEAPPVETGDPFAVEGLLREEQLPLLKDSQPAVADVALGAPPKGVPAAPASCDAYVKRKAASKVACADKAASLAALDAALDAAEPTKEGVDPRDEALVAVEACAALPPGFVRALRIELAPPECGDGMAEPLLKSPPKGMPGALQHALIGQSIAARLHRTVGAPPPLKPPFNKQRVLDYTQKTLFPWFNEQAVAVQELAKRSQELSSYGKGVVALAAGWADLRMVEVLREAPIPDEFKKDPDLGNAYYASLDERLEPRKTRGRDGALVGLREMAAAGVIVDLRTQRTRAILAKMYGGRKVDALDALALTALPSGAVKSVEEKLGGKLPTFYSGLLFDPSLAENPAVLAAVSRRGLPLSFRSALKEADARLTPELRSIHARARLALAAQYWRAVDVDAAISAFAKIPKDKLTSADKLAFALALGLRSGPEDVAAMMLKNDPFSPKFAFVGALDAVAKETADERGFAAYDAAVLRQIAAPRDADAKYWGALEQRYREAAKLLTDPRLKAESEARAHAAQATQKVLGTTMP